AAPPARPGAAAGAPPAGGSHGGRPSPRHSSCRRGGGRAPAGAFSLASHALGAAAGACVAACGGHGDGSAVACGLNREVQCDLLALVGGLAYAAHLLPALLLQASPDGDPVRFLTFSEAERCRVGAGPSAVLTDVCGQLAAEHRAGRPGPRDPWRGRCGLARWPMAGCSAAPWPGRRSAAPCAPGLPGGAAAPRSRGPHGIGGARRAGLRQSAAAGAPAGGVGRRARQRDRPRAVRGVLR
ncbi:unnamed protein product, partial [Prorocentrum cordatum]